MTSRIPRLWLILLFPCLVALASSADSGWNSTAQNVRVNEQTTAEEARAVRVIAPLDVGLFADPHDWTWNLPAETDNQLTYEGRDTAAAPAATLADTVDWYIADEEAGVYQLAGMDWEYDHSDDWVWTSGAKASNQRVGDFQQVYDKGYDDGLGDGYSWGYDEGKDDGYDKGYQDGYREGYDDADDRRVTVVERYRYYVPARVYVTHYDSWWLCDHFGIYRPYPRYYVDGSYFSFGASSAHVHFTYSIGVHTPRWYPHATYYYAPGYPSVAYVHHHHHYYGHPRHGYPWHRWGGNYVHIDEVNYYDDGDDTYYDLREANVITRDDHRPRTSLGNGQSGLRHGLVRTPATTRAVPQQENNNRRARVLAVGENDREQDVVDRLRRGTERARTITARDQAPQAESRRESGYAATRERIREMQREHNERMQRNRREKIETVERAHRQANEPRTATARSSRERQRETANRTTVRTRTAPRVNTRPSAGRTTTTVVRDAETLQRETRNRIRQQREQVYRQRALQRAAQQVNRHHRGSSRVIQSGGAQTAGPASRPRSFNMDRSSRTGNTTTPRQRSPRALNFNRTGGR